ncbi:YhjD/YihY/BrkB family envelope integrity protein [Bradyrhizobium sp. sBnM-33]|uniref:YhjD/YihY/BrkB family envelope integrity protein n=1 Tax=Bradyrhizobium sp. sBnM-33 TaxID=2831780 RepID=UPI001BCF5F98|nr:YhjD/YihY/BrkB family envelope integrity protein [Bradyrhizobium sp. sBnM-33]WOH54396.1 YhjD/YihY/BrkB family envelope integrity protein [Bradyrhizobium sp. sBnM-33]
MAALGSNVDRFVGRQRRAIASEQWAADKVVLSALNTVVPIGIFTLLFAAIYRVLPDTDIYWCHLVLSAFVTAVLFTIGKSVIGFSPVAQRRVRPMRGGVR